MPAPTRTATRPAAPARPRVNLVGAAFAKAATSMTERVERLPRVTGGDSKSSPNKYVVQITDATIFDDRDGKRCFVKVLGKIGHVINGYSGESTIVGKRPETYAKALPTGADITVLFYNPNDDQYNYNIQDLLSIIQSLGYTPDPADPSSMFRGFLEVIEVAEGSALAARYYEDMQQQYLEVTSDEDADQVGTMSRDDLRQRSLTSPLVIESFLGKKGKKSDRAGDSTVNTNFVVFNPAAFPDFDLEEWIAENLDQGSVDEK
jgi:hypothetical protein